MRPPRPAAKPRTRVACPSCGVDVAMSRAGRLSRHTAIITPYWVRVWCPSGGTIMPESKRHPVPDWRIP